MAFFDADVFDFYKQGDKWLITKNGEIYLTGLKSREDAQKIVETLDRDQRMEDDGR